MSRIKRLLGQNEPEENEPPFTEEDIALLQEEGFEWNEYAGWTLHDEKDGFGIYIEARQGYFNLYISEGAYNGEAVSEHTFYHIDEGGFEAAYEAILHHIDLFFWPSDDCH